MEICKQLFDIASLFDIVNDLSITAKTFNKFAMVELQYRGESPDAIRKVLDDIYDTARCIVMRGQESQEEFELIQDGIKKKCYHKRFKGSLSCQTYWQRHK